MEDDTTNHKPAFALLPAGVCDLAADIAKHRPHWWPVLVAVARRMPDCFEKQAELAKETRRNRTTVNRALHQMVETGVLARSQGPRRTATYNWPARLDTPQVVEAIRQTLAGVRPIDAHHDARKCASMNAHHDADKCASRDAHQVCVQERTSGVRPQDAHVYDQTHYQTQDQKETEPAVAGRAASRPVSPSQPGGPDHSAGRSNPAGTTNSPTPVASSPRSTSATPQGPPVDPPSAAASQTQADTGEDSPQAQPSANAEHDAGPRPPLPAKRAKLTAEDRERLRSDLNLLCGWLNWGIHALDVPANRWRELELLERGWVAKVAKGQHPIKDAPEDLTEHQANALAFFTLQCLRQNAGMPVELPKAEGTRYDLYLPSSVKNKRAKTILGSLPKDRSMADVVKHIKTVFEHTDAILERCDGLNLSPDIGFIRHGAVVKHADQIRVEEDAPQDADMFGQDIALTP